MLAYDPVRTMLEWLSTASGKRCLLPGIHPASRTVICLDIGQQVHEGILYFVCGLMEWVLSSRALAYTST